MFPVIIKWPITIYTYGFMISTGVLAALYVLGKMGKRNGVSTDNIMELIIWLLISGFIGARILYIIVEWKLFIHAPLRVVFSRSGFVFYGGFLTGIPVLIWRVKKLKLHLWKVLDMFSVTVPLAHAFGRLGCFAFGCCYGMKTDSWIGIKFPAGSPAGACSYAVVPTQLIEAGLLVVLFFVLYVIHKRNRKEGMISVLYLLSYGIIRFAIEFFRGDDRGGIGALSTSQLISVLMMGVAILIYFMAKTKRKP